MLDVDSAVKMGEMKGMSKEDLEKAREVAEACKSPPYAEE